LHGWFGQRKARARRAAAAMELQQQWRSWRRHGAGLERAGDGKGREREIVERVGELGSLYLCTWGEVASEGSAEQPRGVTLLPVVGSVE